MNLTSEPTCLGLSEISHAKEKMERLYYGYDYAGTLIGVSLSKPVFIFNASDEYEWLSAERAT